MQTKYKEAREAASATVAFSKGKGENFAEEVFRNMFARVYLKVLSQSTRKTLEFLSKYIQLKFRNEYFRALEQKRYIISSQFFQK